MQENKMNWGTLILGIVIGVVVVGVVWMASKPQESAGEAVAGLSCEALLNIPQDAVCASGALKGAAISCGINLTCTIRPMPIMETCLRDAQINYGLSCRTVSSCAQEAGLPVSGFNCPVVE